jgi:ankyrin repeat protein
MKRRRVRRKKRELELLRTADQRNHLKEFIRRGDLAETKRLLDAHPDFLGSDLWPLAIFQAKSVEMTRLLLDRGLRPDECTAPRKPLHLAVYQCLPDIVDLLIERGADVNLRNPLDETPLELLDAYEPRPVGDPEAARIRKALRDAGAKDDLYTVIRAGEVEELRALLKADPSLARADNSLGGPLFVAARSGRVEVTKLLLEYGADPNTVNSAGNTPLWFAAQSPARPASDRIAVMKLLLDAGADLHARCEDGTTALHFAAWRGPAEVVRFLLSKGADRSLTNDHGATPLQHAMEWCASEDKEEIVRLLEEARSS